MKEVLLVKEDSETNMEYGSYPHERDTREHIENGIVILDKPSGPTSHEVAAWVRNMLEVKKVGHSGTLDPAVTGVLTLTIGNAVKIMPALARAKKEYVCIMRLHKKVEDDKIRKVMLKFTGKIKQMPPVKSAVKRQLRERVIYNIDILEIDGQYVLFRAETEAGVYIRKLCDDIGKQLKINSQMQQLRRTKAGLFEENKTVNLYDLKDAYEFCKEGEEKYLREVILPLEFGVQHLKKIIIKDSAISAICYGAPLHVTGISKISKDIKENEMVAIMSLKGELVALAEAKLGSEAMLKKRSGVAIKTKRVIMKRNVYPKGWGG